MLEFGQNRLGGNLMEALHDGHRLRAVAGLLALFAAPLALAEPAADWPSVAGIPVDFILFAATLISVALFHHYVLQVALIGVTTIATYKILFTGFKAGAGIAGFGLHMAHEWVLLVNLLCLLVGFALLARHFEDSDVPEVLPKLLPESWLGPFVLLIIIFLLSGFLDNIAAALIGGTIAASVFKRKVHIGYLAAIVAASNAGGAGSVVGDTTTTMMWIDGVSPLDVVEAYLPAAVATIVFGIPAALMQHKHSPITRNQQSAHHIDWARVGIVLSYSSRRLSTNVTVNLKFAALADGFPFLGVAVWVALLLAIPLRKPEWSLMPDAIKGTIFLLALVTCASMMPVEKLPPASWLRNARPRLHLRRLRQHPADRAGAQAGRLRLGLAGLRRRFRRLDAVVRLVGRRGGIKPVPRSQIGGSMAAPRLDDPCRLRDRLLRHPDRAGLESA